MTEFKPTIVFDFDGVIHSYVSGWTGVAPEDPPVEGALECIRGLMNMGYEIVIQSTRASKENEGGDYLIREWLQQYDFPVEKIKVTAEKVPAVLYIDDRALRFEGDFNAIFRLMGKKGRMFSTWVGKTKGKEEQSTER